MRVALIGPLPPQLGGSSPGGVATHQMHLAAGLAAAGIEAPLLATNTSSDPSVWNARARAGDGPFPFFRMGGPVRLRRQYLTAVGPGHLARYAAVLAVRPSRGSRRDVLANLLWYRAFLTAVRPHVVHVQHPLERCEYLRFVQRLEGWRLPLIVTAHSLFGEHAEDTIASRMAPNLRAADRVIAVSGHIADQAVQLGVDPARVRVIRSGVDLQRFRLRDRLAARRALEIDGDTPVVLFVGNLEPRKQVDVLLRAMACVQRTLPAARLVVVGSGQSAGALDQTALLTRLVAELQLEPAVQFAGRVSDEQLLEFYAAADVFALPSSSEAQGIVALEAMAAGLPVVASAVGGLLETIADGRTGCLVPSGDSAALARALVLLLENETRRRTLAAAGRLAVEREFSWAHSVEATIEVYRDALGQP